MDFQKIHRIEDYNFYLDLAFRKAKKRAQTLSKQLDLKKLERTKVIELERINTIKQLLYDRFSSIIKSYPNFDKFSIFYKELIKCTLDYKQLKKSLGAIQWAKEKIYALSDFYTKKIRNSANVTKMNSYRKEFYGRIASILKQIRNALKYLEHARRVIKGYPIIKDKPTVAICGFPNVGKTTLLFKLTGSKPEINLYAFTTKNINIGYLNNIQLLDTPGTLNRLNKMNNIEKQAYLAIKYCADLLIYVFDLTEPYPLNKQVRLLNNLKKLNKDIILYLSKTDIIDKNKIKDFSKIYNCITDISSLKKILCHRFSKQIEKQS